MKKILLTISLICVVFSTSHATPNKPIAASKTSEKTEDPDLKLSIEELRKKYPISLLDKKKKNYKPGQKINIDDYSIEEIKAVFLNADRNFLGSKPIKGEVVSYGNVKFLSDRKVSVFSDEELGIIEAVCLELGQKYDSSKLTKKQRTLQMFVFPKDKIMKHIYPYISDIAQDCFFTNDPLNAEDRN